MAVIRCEIHGEELEGEWEDNPPATRIVVSSDHSIALCESCYKMIRRSAVRSASAAHTASH
jgi:hypothetical protein